MIGDGLPMGHMAPPADEFTTTLVTATPSIPTMPWLWSHQARPLRFVIVGVCATIVQLVCLELLLEHAMPDMWSDLIGFVLGAQVSFTLHASFTWRDRPMGGVRDIGWHWLRFMATIASTAVLNDGIFLRAAQHVPVLIASVLASVAVSGLNYLIANLVVFHVAPQQPISR